MNFMIPFLIAMLPASAEAHSQSAGPSGVPSVAIPKTTEVLVILTPRQGVTPQQIMAVIPEEIRATVKLYLDGKIREWYSRGDGRGAIFLLDAGRGGWPRACILGGFGDARGDASDDR